MAQFLVRSSLNPNRVVKFGITVQKGIVDVSNLSYSWIIEIGTMELDIHGNKIEPIFISTLNFNNIDKEIENSVSILCNKIDWAPSHVDFKAPYIENIFPANNDVVPIDSNLHFSLTEDIPSAGIDIDTLSIKINGVEVKDELWIKGDVYKYEIFWEPKLKEI